MNTNKKNEINSSLIKNNDKENITVCRCMEVKEDQIREAVRNGAHTVDAVKRATMAGMGLCQSKTCYILIARIISEELKLPISEIQPMRIRIPVRPVKVSSFDLEN